MMEMEEGIFVQHKIESVVVLVLRLGILEALAEPVVTEPRGGMDKGPPLVGEIIHRTISQRHEHRSVGIQGRRR